MKHKPTVFLTGATGYLGSYLLKIFLSKGHRVYALSRSTPKEKAAARVYSAVGYWDKNIARQYRKNLVVIEGDVAVSHCGIAKNTLEQLRDEVEEIYHSAANTNVQVPYPKIYKINAGGTEHVCTLGLEWQKQGRLKKINHISTAFVCGKYEGIFKEADLDKGQDFFTSYEKSKFEAEKLVHAYRKKGLWIDIFRPSIVIGESKTGKNFQFKNIYKFIHMCSLELFDILPLKNASVSIIPIDYTCEAIYRLASHSREQNRVYHILFKNAMSVKDIVLSARKIFGFKVPRFVSRKDFTHVKLTSAQKGLLQRTLLAFNTFVQFDSTYTRKQLAFYGYRYPVLAKADLVSLLNDYFKKEGV